MPLAMDMAIPSGCSPGLHPRQTTPPGVATPWLGTTRPQSPLRPWTPGNPAPSSALSRSRDVTHSHHQAQDGPRDNTRVMSPNSPRAPPGDGGVPSQPPDHLQKEAFSPGGRHKAATGLQPSDAVLHGPGVPRRPRVRAQQPGYRMARLLPDVEGPRATDPPPGLCAPAEGVHQVGCGGSFWGKCGHDGWTPTWGSS